MKNLNLYHYDNENFREGDFITKRHRLSPEVVKAYELEIGMDASKLVYMLDHEEEDYEEVYKYLYNVEPLGRVKKVMMDFSPIMCQDYLDRINKMFNREKVAEMFAYWYNGGHQDKNYLNILNIPASNKVEYVTDKPIMVKEREEVYFKTFESNLNYLMDEFREEERSR